MTDQGPITAPKGPAADTPAPDVGITPPGTPAPDTGTSPTPPVVDVGTAKTVKPDQATAPVKTEDADVFFDPKDLPEELLPYHKQLQAAFTKKTQAIKGEREKIEAYNAFMQDIPGNLQLAAQQYGFRMVPAQQGYPPQAGAGEQSTQPFGPDWQPQNYGELYQATEERIMQKLQRQFGPVFDNVQKLAVTNVERQLTEIDPDWRLYEDEMTANLQKHRTLAEDIPLLYKMTVPEEVLNSRAVQAALKKMEEKAKSAKIQGKGTTTPSAPARTGKPSFQQAVDDAREDLAKRGVKS